MPAIAWRWKKLWPPMPSGARSIEHGRPSRCCNMNAPAISKYRARSSFVTGRPSPAFGHSALSGLDILTPMTVDESAPARGASAAPGAAAARRAGPARDAAAVRARRAPLPRPLVSVRRPRCAGSWPGVASDFSTASGCSATTSLAGLSCRNPLKAACRIIPGIRPAGELDLRHQPGPKPAHVALLARRVVAAERALFDGQCLELRQELLGGLSCIAGADAADIDEVAVAIDAREQRSQGPRLRGPAAQHDLVPRTALGFSPAVASSRQVRRRQALGDDALEPHVARRFQDGIPA